MGTAINEILFEARGRLKQARVEEFVRQVADEVGKLKEESIDREFLRSEAFSDLIDDVLVRASRTRSAEKKGRLRKVCVDAIQGRYEPDFTDLFLGILDQITDHEMAVLKGFSKLAEARAKGEKLEVGEIEYRDGLWGMQATEAKLVVQALVAKGLLVDTTFGRWGPAEPFRFVEPTDLGVRFLVWLGNPTTP